MKNSIYKKELWNGWNFNMSHNKYINDKNNYDIIAFMSSIMQPEYPNIIMIYNPTLYNDFVKKDKESYFINSGTMCIYPFNEINIEKSN